MKSTDITSRQRLCEVAVACVFAIIASPVLAQEQPSAPEPNLFTAAGGVDVASQYVFRGVRQNSTGLAVLPFATLTARVLSDEGMLRRIDVSFGFWNSLNTGDTGAEGPAGRPWYESRPSGTVAFQFRGGTSVAASYTAYVSPNDMFSTVKELGVRLTLDDRRALGARAVYPYALFAFEVDTSPGTGQLDGGLHAGKYLELGATPGYAGRRASVTFPVKVGLSLRDYYELGVEDNRFGFISLAGVVTVPVGPSTRAGRWHVRGGLEFRSQGETTRVFNGGDRSTMVASCGFGWTR